MKTFEQWFESKQRQYESKPFQNLRHFYGFMEKFFPDLDAKSIDFHRNLPDLEHMHGVLNGPFGRKWINSARNKLFGMGARQKVTGANVGNIELGPKVIR